MEVVAGANETKIVSPLKPSKCVPKKEVSGRGD